MSTETGHPKFPVEEIQLRSLAVQFVASVVKALQESSQYAPDHPEVKRYVASLYQQFQTLIRDRTEVTFLAKIGGDSKDVVLDGIFAEAVNLGILMPQAMGDLFLPKLREYFDRRRLLSWSIKADIPPGEFEGFLRILSAFVGPAGDRDANVPAETAKALAAQGITHASLVFMEELVGRDRQLPWRVELALTRLRKDLRGIPFYRKSDATEIKRAKAQVISDTIRPLRRPDLLKEILLNCDLIAKDLGAAGEEAVELEIINCLPLGLIGPTALELAKAVEEIGPAGKAPQRERARGLLRALVARLHDEPSPDGDRFLTHIFERKLVRLADLPPRLQEAIAARQFTDAFLAHEPQHLERLRGCGNDPAAVAPYARIVPELLRREKYSPALTILRTLESGCTRGSPSGTGFAVLMDNIRAAVTGGDLLQTLVEHFRGGCGGVREKVVEVLAALGQPGVLPLVEALVRSEDADLRRHLVAALGQIGMLALGAIRVAFERPADIPPRTARDLLTALAQIGSPDAADTVHLALTHPDASVREDAVAVLTRIFGHEAEAKLLTALKDQAEAVRRRALLCLGTIGSSNPQVIDFLCEVVRKRRKDEAEEDDHLQVHACQALAEVGRAGPSVLSRIESVLIQALDLDGGKGLLGRWRGTAGKSDPVRGAICTVLGQIGGPEAAHALARMNRDRNPAVRDRAARALRQLEGRASPQAA